MENSSRNMTGADDLDSTVLRHQVLCQHNVYVHALTKVRQYP